MEPEKSNWLEHYAKHVLIAWPGIFLATLVVGILVSATPLVYLFSPDLNAPWFPGMALVGLLVGYAANRRDRSRAGVFAFTAPLGAFVLFVWQSEAFPKPYGGWYYVWQNYFTRNCGATECLGELLATGPLYAGVAYSLGAWWARRRGRSRNDAGSPRMAIGSGGQ